MSISFEEFKQSTLTRKIGDFRSHKKLVEEIESLYNVEDFKFFYAKNLFNEKDIELYIFLKDGFVHCKLDEHCDEIHHYHGKPASKHFLVPNDGSKKVMLNVLYDNGEELLFDSIEDSNSTWHQEYINHIRELYDIL